MQIKSFIDEILGIPCNRTYVEKISRDTSIVYYIVHLLFESCWRPIAVRLSPRDSHILSRYEKHCYTEHKMHNIIHKQQYTKHVISKFH
jgi:hypothetical protein